MEKIAFKNHKGQVIEVGDEVIMIAMGAAKRQNIRRGVYLGLTNGNPSCKWASSTMRFFVDGQIVPWKSNIKHGKWQYVDVETQSTLRNGRVYKIDTTMAEVFL